MNFEEFNQQPNKKPIPFDLICYPGEKEKSVRYRMRLVLLSREEASELGYEVGNHEHILVRKWDLASSVPKGEKKLSEVSLDLLIFRQIGLDAYSQDYIEGDFNYLNLIMEIPRAFFRDKQEFMHSLHSKFRDYTEAWNYLKQYKDRLGDEYDENLLVESLFRDYQKLYLLQPNRVLIKRYSYRKRISESREIAKRLLSGIEGINSLEDLLEKSRFDIDLESLQAGFQTLTLEEDLSEDQIEFIANWLSDLAIYQGFRDDPQELSYIKLYNDGLFGSYSDGGKIYYPSLKGVLAIIRAYELYYLKLPDWLILKENGFYNFSEQESDKLRDDLRSITLKIMGTEPYDQTLTGLRREVVIKFVSRSGGSNWGDKSTDVLLGWLNKLENLLINGSTTYKLNKVIVDKKKWIQEFNSIKEYLKVIDEKIAGLPLLLHKSLSTLQDRPGFKAKSSPYENQWIGASVSSFRQRIISSGGKPRRLHIYRSTTSSGSGEVES